MFVPTDVQVSNEEGSSVLKVPKSGLLESVNLVSQNPQCSLMENIMGEGDKIDNIKAKTLLDTIVTNVSMKEFQIESPTLKMGTLLGLLCLTLTQRLLRWNRIRTTITGPAVNFKV